MPSVPEFCRTLCLEGGGEIILESITEQKSYSDRHIGVTRKIAIKLDGESDAAHQIFES